MIVLYRFCYRDTNGRCQCVDCSHLPTLYLLEKALVVLGYTKIAKVEEMADLRRGAYYWDEDYETINKESES